MGRDFFEWIDEDRRAGRTIKQEFDCAYCEHEPPDDVLCEFDDKNEAECSHFEERPFNPEQEDY